MSDKSFAEKHGGKLLLATFALVVLMNVYGKESLEGLMSLID